MKNVIALFGLILTIGLVSSCGDKDDDKVGTVNVNFKAYWGNNPVIMNEDVWYFNDETMNFSRLNLFVSELTLTGDENEELSEAEFVDFETINRTEEGAAQGVTFSYDVPVGTYDNFDFGVGVSPELNSQEPSSYPSSHALGQFGSYWTAWNSFIFSKTEGKFDSDGDDQADMAFVYHIGSDRMYRTISAVGPIDVAEGRDVNIDVVINYKTVFGDANNHIDVIANPAFHSPQDSALAALTEMLAENFKSAIVVEMK